MCIQSNFLKEEEVIRLVNCFLRDVSLPMDDILVDRLEYDGAEYRNLKLTDLTLNQLKYEKLAVHFSDDSVPHLRGAEVIDW